MRPAILREKSTPHALELLRRRAHAVEHLRPKEWAEFAAEDAPNMDLVITVCDSDGSLSIREPHDEFSYPGC